MPRYAANSGGRKNWHEQVEEMRVQASKMPEGPERTALVNKADQLYTAYLLNESLLGPSVSR
jgi:hypothetical protein